MLVSRVFSQRTIKQFTQLTCALSASVYSNGSTSTSGFSSPAQATFAIPRDSASPQLHSDAPIRLPNGGLSDACSLVPRKAATSPPTQYYTPAQYAERATTQVNADYDRRGSVDPFALPSSAGVNGIRRAPSEIDIPEATGWQAVPMESGPAAAGKAPGRATPRSKTISVS